MPARVLLFVSHANPEDNVFAQWLSMKLAGYGYQVWSDVTKLLGGEGVLKEVYVANAVARHHGFKDFIIPLRIDDIPHSEINIEIGRLNVIEFGESWAVGLKQLLEELHKEGVPASTTNGHDIVRQWWERERTAESGITDEPEVHYSNWFPLELPKFIYRYTMIGLLGNNLTFPFPFA
jgi:hypothetical protein